MIDWVTDIFSTWGYWGIAFIMFLENVFPPLPSEVVIPLAGLTVSRGEMEFVPALLAGISGALTAALLWYAVGRWLGLKRLRRWVGRHDKWLWLSVAAIDQSKQWFERYGKYTVLLGRMLPAIRTFVSIPAGACVMPLFPFLIYSAIGITLWTGLLMGAGYKLGDEYGDARSFAHLVSVVIVLLLLSSLATWMIKRRIKKFRQRP